MFPSQSGINDMRVLDLLAAVSMAVSFATSAHASGNQPEGSANVQEHEAPSKAVLNDDKAQTPEEWHATSSFVAPSGCVDDSTLAIAVGAVQACVQRFSETHQFIIHLREFRVIPSQDNSQIDDTTSAQVVHDHTEKLRAANEGQKGQILGMFEYIDIAKPEGRPEGADHCSQADSMVSDRRVPGYKREEFRIWAETFVCARADTSNNTIQLVELRASERFRVSTDNFKERFTYLDPIVSAIKAQNSLRMF